jgi:nondiscriminating glutamyl-tRNA synthetase
LIYFVRAGFITRATDASLGFLTTLLPMAVGSVDRLEEIPDRVAFLFSWDASRASALVAAESDGPRAIRAMHDEIVSAGPLDRDRFRAAVSRVREKTGLKGRALLHPVRVAITVADSGPELDLVIPAVDRGAALGAGSGVMPVPSCAERLRVVTELLE